MLDVKAALGLAGAPGDPELDVAGLEASVYRDSFADFAVRFWPVIDPREFAPNTATDAITTVLQAVADGRLRRVRIEVGPGLGKTSLLSLYLAWKIARDPAHRVIAASHSYEVVVDGLSKRARRVVESEEFVAMFGVRLREDENTAGSWATTENGRVTVVGVGGALTGRRAGELIVDDAMNAVDYPSKATRDATGAWFGAAFSTRLDGDGPMIVVGQRLGVDDIHGRLSGDPSWAVLTLPAEFDPRRRCVVRDLRGELVWQDPRTEVGELIAPAILSADKLAGLRTSGSMGARDFQAQYNQEPSSDEGSVCPASLWRFHQPGATSSARRPPGCDESPAVEMPAKFDAIVIGADLTFGAEKGDFAVVQAWGACGSGRYLLRHWRARAGFDEQVAAIKRFAAEFPRARVVVERAANGAAVIERLRREIRNTVEPMVPVGSKAQRLASVIGVIDNGQAFLPDGANYVAELVDEFQTFPGRHDDILDAAVWCLFALQGKSGVWPDVLAQRERAERIARCEEVEPEVPMIAKLNHLWLGTPIPGKPRDAATGRLVTHECYFVDGACVSKRGDCPRHRPEPDEEE